METGITALCNNHLLKYFFTEFGSIQKVDCGRLFPSLMLIAAQIMWPCHVWRD